MVEMDGGGEGEDKTSALLEASKYEVHARIIDDQKRHRRTPDEVVSTYCGFVENKLQAPTHLQVSRACHGPTGPSTIRQTATHAPSTAQPPLPPSSHAVSIK